MVCWLTHRRLFALTAAVFLWWGAAPARAQDSCDLALVLAMDVSGSVSYQEFEMQRDSAAEALLDRRVARAVASGRFGQIAVMVTQWSNDAVVTVPWRIVHADELETLAAEIRGTVRHLSGSTGVARGILHAVDELRKCPCRATRQVIDVSGDGRNNLISPTMAQAQAATQAADIEVNGLAIVNDEIDVVAWYHANVRSPTGFVIEANGFEAVAQAMRIKLLREITSGGQVLAGMAP